MAVRDRRRSAPAPGLSALLFLVAACGGAPGAAPAGDVRAAEAAPAEGVEPAAPEPRGPRSLPPERRWDEPLRALVEDGLRRVEAETAQSARPVRAGEVGISVHVLELAEDGPLEVAALEADVPRVPASNLKLVTTAAALVLLGPGTEFLTPAEALGPIEGGVLRGDLVLRASGDPFVEADGDARVEARLDRLAGDLRARGVRRIAGDVVLDEGSFLEPGPGPGWPDASQYWQEHCALAAGFTLNGGVLQARVDPRGEGRPASVEVHPAPHGLRESYGVRTERGRLDVRVGATRTTCTVRGTIPPDVPLYLPDFAHPDPVELFGRVLLDRLERGGVTVEGDLRRARNQPAGVRVAELRSPVDATLGPINADSRNSVADQLFLALGLSIGGAGTRDAGAAATREALRRLGVPVEGFRQVDGSGLSRDDRVTARQLTALLAGVFGGDPRAAEVFADSLAVAGRSGTLENRLRGTAAEGRVRGKTGWIRGVSTLSGRLERPGAPALVFAILIEYPPEVGGLNTRVFKPLQDELLVALSGAGS